MIGWMEIMMNDEDGAEDNKQMNDDEDCLVGDDD